MDKIIKITLGLFLVILLVFVSVASYNYYVETAYRTSLVSTYSYSCTITTSTQLSNVTFFLPLPARVTGNSAVIERIGAGDISGFPGDWMAVLFGTEKATHLKIFTPVIGQPSGSGGAGATSVTFSVTTRSPKIIDTRSPLAGDAVFRPVQDMKDATCPSEAGSAIGSPACSVYTTSLYAKYDAAPDASVSIHAEITGRNNWKIFQPAYNEYRNTFDVSLNGAASGWVPARGWLESGIGSYDVPVLSR
jgi:hypothetical protein